MYGRVPRLLVDILFRNNLEDHNTTSYDKYVVDLLKDLRGAILIAQHHATKQQGRQARLYEKEVKGATIETGDHVLVANRRERRKRKVADHWESGVYTVMSKNAGTHIYKTCNTFTGCERICRSTVHQNLLLLVNFLYIQGEHSVSFPPSFVSSLPEHSIDYR